MILIVTSKDDLTADYLIIRLLEKKLPYFRLNTEDMPLELEGAAFFPECTYIIKNKVHNSINPKKTSGIWYRRPKMLVENKRIDPQIFPYVQEDSWFYVHGLLELTNDSTFWVSRPENIRKAENKIYQLKIACKCGLKVPRTFIGNSPNGVKKLITKYQHVNKTFVAKPVRSGRYYLKNETRLFYTSHLPKKWSQEAIREWPIIIQEEIPKKNDIRVTIFKDKIFSVNIEVDGPSNMRLDWRRDIDKANYKPINLPSVIVNKLLRMLDIMGLSFGAFDLIETPKKEYIFLEINPNGQWAWIEEKTGLPMRDALIKCLVNRN